MFKVIQQQFVPVLIIIYIAFKQLRPKEIKVDSKGKYIILAIGIYDAYIAIANKQLIINYQTVLGLIFTLLILAGGFAFARAYTCQVWQKDGKFYRQGNYVTMILWIIMIISHAITDHIITGLGTTFVLYLGTSLVVQHLVLLNKIKNAN
ncbi:hypothetical protein [uncultured Limosilactobacillus sp.]|uniref:hypothetical protein n=1 Tax=uncultured Limosilactobacillus sp. TaxID=2837629 RepID=UPI0025D415E7|nr:hypothetical protein [uncultured Limosilactobacillus sp.]